MNAGVDGFTSVDVREEVVEIELRRYLAPPSTVEHRLKKDDGVGVLVGGVIPVGAGLCVDWQAIVVIRIIGEAHAIQRFSLLVIVCSDVIEVALAGLA